MNISIPVAYINRWSFSSICSHLISGVGTSYLVLVYTCMNAFIHSPKAGSKTSCYVHLLEDLQHISSNFDIITPNQLNVKVNLR